MIAKCYRQDCTEEERKWYHNKNNKFKALSKEGSYVPPNPDLIRDGRSNPKFIRYLYIAESPTTAVFEVRPLLHNAVNVAGIEVKEQLTISNIAVGIDVDATKDNSVDEWLMYFIQTAFSSSTNNPDDYIASQIIAEYIRHLGYDGIRYSSSLHRGGYNLTVFDVEKCEAVSSTDLRLEDIKMSLRPAIGAVVMDGRFEYIKDNIPMKWDNGELVEAEV
jgi:RES domain-containing protein